MLSSAALRARVASIIDALSRTAVAEIAKVVEDGMMVLRLEMCQRENEINKLKSSMELLHMELSAAREKLGDPSREGRSAGDARSLLVDPSRPELQVKAEPVDECEESRGRADGLAGESAPREGGPGQWKSVLLAEPQRGNSDFRAAAEDSLARLAGLDAAGGLQPGPFGRGLLGLGQLRNLYGAARKRSVKRLMFKKGYICPYCGKCFERAGHLERHKRIHTGEKPYRCEMCGRRFNQKCSLKEHMKIHSRCIEPRRVEIPAGEEKQVVGAHPSDARPAGVDGRSQAERGLAGVRGGAQAAVQVKAEPTEELLLTQERADALTETFGSFEGGGQTWASGSQGLNTEMSGADYSGGSGQTGPQLLPAPADASCSSFSFSGKPYGENGLVSQPPRGPSDTFLVSSDSVPLGAADASGRTVAFEMVKPKKCFACSYCGKMFERSGHLERHLRIHTGEKPYGCHVCGRCFNQNSSLKGHMRTHNKSDGADVLGPRHLMFTAPDHQPLETEPAAALAAFTPTVPGSVSSEAAEERAVLLKVEDFQSVLQAGIDSGPGASGQSQLVACGVEPSGDVRGQTVCLLFRGPQYLSPANKLQGYAPVTDLPFGDDKEAATSSRFPGGGCEKLDVKDQSPERDRTQEPVVCEFTTMALGEHEDASGKNCFICSHCRQSFDGFSSFQMHQCKNVTFTCEICHKVFNQLSLLKLHLKLHAV